MDTSKAFRDALDNLVSLWRGISAPLRDSERLPAFAPDLPDDDAKRLRKLLQECFAGRGGEISARGRAARLGQVYLGLNDQGRRRFLEILARDFPTDRQQLCQAASTLCMTHDDEAYLRAEEQLREQLVSPSLRLLSQFNALPAGVKFIIDLRADLLEWCGEDPRLLSLDRELRRLLATWFDIGFLELRRITWDSPAALLEKLIAYEAVHEIHSWDDLRNRLESDRRCYAFFHPALPEEPLIFVEIALVEGLAGSIQELLDPAAPEIDPQRADTAIFYSISNAQKGLRGISFGNFLIKQVVDDLRRDFPDLKVFSTLSPIPGLGRWLQQVQSEDSDDPLEEAFRLAVQEAAAILEVPPLLRDVVEAPRWWENERVAETLREPLEQMTLRYFHQKRGDGYPVDPVERFHLGNGSRIERINWLGDTSSKGLRQACGLMVNYRYKLEDIEKNHEAYVGEQRIVLSKKVRGQLEALDRDRGTSLLRLWKGR